MEESVKLDFHGNLQNFLPRTVPHLFRAVFVFEVFEYSFDGDELKSIKNYLLALLADINPYQHRSERSYLTCCSARWAMISCEMRRRWAVYKVLLRWSAETWSWYLILTYAKNLCDNIAYCKFEIIQSLNFSWLLFSWGSINYNLICLLFPFIHKVLIVTESIIESHCTLCTIKIKTSFSSPLFLKVLQ